jgi:steroid delta-isomerase
MTPQTLRPRAAPDDRRQTLARLVAFFEHMTADDLKQLDEIYAYNAYFRDPFNEVRGIGAIARIYAAMFADLADCGFRIIDVVADGGGAMLTWDFTFRIRKWKPDVVQTIHGATHLKLDASGRIAYHRDYWDAAGELYAKLPVVGALMRYLKRRLA